MKSRKLHYQSSSHFHPFISLSQLTFDFRALSANGETERKLGWIQKVLFFMNLNLYGDFNTWLNEKMKLFKKFTAYKSTIGLYKCYEFLARAIHESLLLSWLHKSNGKGSKCSNLFHLCRMYVTRIRPICVRCQALF